MKYPTLPQLCCRCRQFKMPGLGRFLKSRHKFGRWLWLCSQCEEKRIERENRKSRESKYERIVREALQAVFRNYGIKAEHRVGPYIFDFAVEDLRLLLEIDPHSTHSSVGRKIRDWKKSGLAEEQGWTLVRLDPFPVRRLARRAVSAVREHYQAMFDVGHVPVVTRKEPRGNESPTDKVVGGWIALFHRLYGFQPQVTKTDIEALENFLIKHPQAIIKRVTELFWTAWNEAKERPNRYPVCAKATSMKFFFDHIWNITRELRWRRADILDASHFYDIAGRQICDPLTTTWTAIKRDLENWVEFNQPDKKPEQRWMEEVIERLERDKSKYLIHRDDYVKARKILQNIGMVRTDPSPL